MEPREQTCCGAVEQHTNAPKAALQRMRRNVDIFCKALDDGAEAIVMTAVVVCHGARSHLLRDDPHYAARAQRVVEHTRDLAEVIRDEVIRDVEWRPGRTPSGLPPSAHCNTDRLMGVVEGYSAWAQMTLCGTHLLPRWRVFWILQPELSKALRTRKLTS